MHQEKNGSNLLCTLGSEENYTKKEMRKNPGFVSGTLNFVYTWGHSVNYVTTEKLLREAFGSVGLMTVS